VESESFKIFLENKCKKIETRNVNPVSVFVCIDIPAFFNNDAYSFNWYRKPKKKEKKNTRWKNGIPA
jgi:hypothetical protein